MGGQGGCERRIEVFVKTKENRGVGTESCRENFKKKIGGGGGSGQGGCGQRMGSFYENLKKNGGGGVFGLGGRVGWSGWMSMKNGSFCENSKKNRGGGIRSGGGGVGSGGVRLDVDKELKFL